MPRCCHSICYHTIVYSISEDAQIIVISINRDCLQVQLIVNNFLLGSLINLITCSYTSKIVCTYSFTVQNSRSD